MKTILLPGTMQNNFINSDTCQLKENFAGTIINNQPITINRSKDKWPFGRQVLLMIMILLFSASVVQATTYYTSTNGSPSSTLSWWTNTSGSGSHPSGFTNSADVFIIQNGDNMTSDNAWTVAGNVTINSGGSLTLASSGDDFQFGSFTINSGGIATVQRQLTVTGATTITGTINFGSSSTSVRDMTFTGAVTLNSGAVWNETTTGAAATFNFGGNFTNNATTFTTQNTAHDFYGTGTLSGSTTTNFPTMTFTGNYTNSGTLSSSTLLTVTGATIRLTNNGTITATTALSGTGGVTLGTTGILNIGGASAITTLTATAAGNTVNYTGGTQTVKSTSYSNLTLSGSGAKTTTGATVNGVLSMEGTATTSGSTPTYGGSATLQYKGSSSQTTGTEFPSTFSGTGGVVINNSNGVTLNGNKTISNGLTLISGILTTTTAYTISPSSVTRTSGHVNGKLNLPVASGPQTKTFDIGDATNYTPVNVNFTSVGTAGSLTASTAQGDHSLINTSGIAALKSVNRTWTLTDGGALASYSANVLLNWVETDKDPSTTFANYKVAKYTGSSWSLPTVISPLTTSITAQSISSFGDFQVGESACITPSAYTLSGGSSYCAGGSGVSILLSDSETGVNYELLKDLVATGTILPGTTGSSLTFENVTAAGSYTIRATRTSGGCSADMTNAVQVSITNLPSLTAIEELPPAFCTGSPLVMVAPIITDNGSVVTTHGWQLETAVGSGSFSILSIPYEVAYSDNGKKIRYYATNSCGTTYSNEALLTVDKPITDLETFNYGNPVVCAGSTLTLNSPEGGSYYFWTGPGISFQEGQTLSISNFQSENAGTYTVSIFDVCAPGGVGYTKDIVVTLGTVQFNTVSPISLGTDDGVCTAVVTYDATATSPNSLSLTYTFEGATSGSGGGTGSGSIFNKGNTLVTVTASGCGSLALNDFTVTITDNEIPKITCNAPISVNVDAGTCGAVVTFEEPVGTDNCPGYATVQTAGLPSGATFPVGETINTYEVTDALGHKASCSFTVTVTDNLAPVLTCPVPAAAYDIDPGFNYSTQSFLTSATDNCGIPSIKYYIGLDEITFPYQFAVGTTTVRVEATDVNNQKSSCAFDVKVLDNQPPEITCPDIEPSYNMDAGKDYSTLSFIATATDNSGTPSVKYYIGTNEISFPYQFIPGKTTVKAEATDANNLKTSCTFDVIVIDNQNPVISCPVDIAKNVDPDKCGATVDFVATATDNVSVVVSYSHNPGTLFPVGVTTVTATATDPSNNTDVCTFTVTVTDNQNPVITTNGDKTVNTDPDVCGASVDVSAEATDNCIIGSPIGGRSDLLPLNALYPVGTTTITWNVTDAYSNDAAPVIQTVFVKDNQNPVIITNGDKTVNTDLNVCGATVTITAEASDNCIVGAPVGVRSDLLALDALYPVGTTTITWNVKDANKNDATTVIQTVDVKDNQNPVITTNGDKSVNTDPNTCGAVVTVSSEATDNCLVGTPVGVRSDFLPLDALYPVGKTTITWNVKDANNNNATPVIQTIDVTDNQKPVISCPGNISQNVDPDMNGAVVNFAATVIDNCVTVITYSQNPGTIFPVGVTTVTATATDPSNNTDVCIFTVTVLDNQAPVITCPGDIIQNVDTDKCGANVNFVATATDNNTAVVTYSQNPNTFFPVGVTTVTATATDPSDNTDVCTFTVTVTDNQNPVITTNGDKSVNTDFNVCGAAVTVSAEATDNCVVGTPIGVRSDLLELNALYPVGTTTITWNVKDANDNDAATVVQTVIVTDNQIPVITTNGNKTVNTDLNACGATVIVSAEATDNCLVGTLVGVRSDLLALNSLYPVGTTTITWNVKDANKNNATTVIQTVVVTDNEKPVISCAAPVNVNAAANQCNAIVDVTLPAYSDNCGIASIIGLRSDFGTSLTLANHSGSFNIGTTYIQWKVVDIHGNENTCVQSVIVKGSTLTLTPGAPVNAVAAPGICASASNLDIAPPVASLPCAVLELTSTRSDGQLLLSAPFNVGVTTIYWTAIGADHQNVANCTQTVTVIDDQPPVFVPTGPITHTAEAGACSYTFTPTAPLATDNCSGIITVTGLRGDNLPLGAAYPIGNTTITWSATDAHGNTGTSSTEVTITDNEKPVISNMPADISISNEAGVCDAVATWTSALAADNCGTVSDFTSDHASGERFPVGTTTVTYTAKDNSGNIQTAAFNVTVNDVESPVVTYPQAQVFCKSSDNIYTIPLLEAKDNCGIDETLYNVIITGATTRSGSGNDASGVFNVGVSTISWVVIDIHHNFSQGSTTVTVNPLPTASIEGNVRVCKDAPAPVITFTGASGTAPYVFTYSLNGGNDQTITSIGNTATITQATGIPGTYVYTLISVADANACSQLQGGTATVVVNEPLSAPVAGNNQAICWGDPAAQLSVKTPATGGTGPYSYEWLSSPDGLTNWNNAGSGTTIDPGDLYESVYYKVIATDLGFPACGSIESTIVAITVGQPFTGPSVGNDQTICYGTAPSALTVTIPATGGTGNFNYIWEKSSNGTTGWTLVNFIGTSYTPPALTTTTWYKVVGKNACGSVECLNTVKITVQSPVIAGVIASDQTICAGNAPVAFTSSSSGSGEGAMSYIWEISTNGTDFTPIQGSNGLTYQEVNLLYADTWYRRVANSTLNTVSCTANSNAVKVTVNPAPAAPTASDQTVCSDGTLTQTLTATATGGVITWYDAATLGNIVATPTQVGVGKVTYYAQASNGTCPSLTRTAVTLTINPVPAAPVASNQTVCSDGTTKQSLTATATGGTIAWYDAAHGGNLVSDPTLVGVGSVTYYAEASDGTCPSLLRTPVELTINAIPSVTAGVYGPVCADAPDVALIGNPTGGIWTGAGTSGNQTNGFVFDPSSGTQTLTYTYTDQNGCTASDLVTITVNLLPILQAEMNITTVVANNDGIDEHGAYAVCNTPNNINFVAFTDLVGLLPAGSVKVHQEIVTTNVTVPFCNDCAASASAFAGVNGTAALINPAIPGELIMKFRAFFDTNNNGKIDANECAGDWIIYTVTVNPATGITSFTAGKTTLCQDAPDETYVATASYSNSITYSVLPVEAGVINASSGVMNWDAAFAGTATITATSTGLCGTTIADLSVMVNPSASVSAGIYIPVCVDANDVTLAGAPSGGIWTGTGVTGSDPYVFDPSVGTQTLTYTVTNTGGCVGFASTTIIVTPNNTITLSSAPGTDAQTAFVNNAITKITYTTTGATEAIFSGLPDGVTGSFADNVVTISGNPTAVGTSDYSVLLTGGCGTISANGSIKVEKAGSSITVIGNPSYTYTGTVLGPDSNTHTGSTGSVTYLYSGISSSGNVYGPLSTKPINAGSYQVIATLASDDNYNEASSAAFIFTIDKALLTVTAGSQSVSFGTLETTVIGAGTYSIFGFVNSENSSVVGGTVGYTTTYTATTPANTPGITITPEISKLLADNYSFTAASGSISITISKVSISVTGGTFTYNTAPHPATGSAFGVNNEVLPVTFLYNGTGSTIYGPTADAPVNAGTYLATATFAANGNYESNFETAPITIIQAQLTVRINANSKIYNGNANADITYAYIFDGLINGDVLTAAAGAGSFDDKKVGDNKVVTATVILQGNPVIIANYTFNPIATTTANITPLSIDATFTANNKVYDGSSMAVINPVLTGVLGGDNVTLLGPATFSDPNVGTGKPVTLNSPYLFGGDAGNYTLASFGTATANITRAPLTITATNQTKVYGSTFTLHNPAEPTDFTVVGLVSPDVVNNVTLISNGAVATATVNTYPIIVDGATGNGLDNYSFIYSNAGILTVTPKALTITANDMAKAYGETLTFTGTEFTAAGLVNGNSVTNVSLTSAGAAASANADTYDIVPAAPVTGPGLSNYAIDYKPGTLTVGNRILTVTVDNVSRLFGADNPSFTSVITGQNPGETFTVTYETSAVPTSPVGNYAIVPTVHGPLGNYLVVLKNGTLTVNRINLIITPLSGQSKMYGSIDPGFGFTVSPALNAGEIIGGALSREAGENAGSYAYTIGTLSAGQNYSLTLSTGSTFTIISKVIVITPTAGQTKVFGTIADPTPFTYTSSPSLNIGDSFGGALARATGESVGTFAFNVGTLSAGPNYTLTVAPGSTFSITPKALNITANNRSKAAGTTVTFTGTEFSTGAGELVNGTSVATVILTSTGAAASAAAGTYPIVANGALGTGLSNYSITYHDGTLTVTGRPTLTVTANNSSRIYGAANPVFTGTVVGGLNGENFTVTYSTSATPASPVGTYNIVPSITGATIGNYTVVLVNGTLTVGKATLTVTADNKFKIYRTSNPPLTATITGYVNGDTRASSVTGNPNLSTSATTNSQVGTYTIRVTQGSLASANYSFTFVNGTLTIARRATLTVTANNLSRSYGSNNPALTVTYSGFINGETFATSGITGSPSVTTAANSASNAGTYTITAAQGTLASSRYNFTFVNGTLTVNKAALTITASNGTKTYGTVKNFAGTEFSTAGLVNGNTVTSVILTSTGSSATAAVGTYPIVANAANGTGLGNYTISYINGTLTVNPATLTITPDAGQSKVYGSVNPVFTFTHTPLVGAGDVTGQMGRLAGENVGTYAFTLGTLTAGPNYTLAIAATPTFRITPLPVTVTARPQTKRQGTSDPVLTYISNPAVGSVLANGQVISFTGTLTRVRGESVGVYPILLGSLGNSNYTITYVGSTLRITRRFGNISSSVVLSDSTLIESTENAVTSGEIGLNVYPNPFTDRLYFDLQLQADAKVILEVYNISGVKLARVFSEDVKALTNYRIEYVPEGVSSQILIYRLFINGKIYFTGKAIHK